MINDSAGISINLNDKSERASTAIGFRSAAVIESARGLCETPVLISSEADYVKTFGAPALDKYGMASMEAYLLAQRRVPQVITRAKDPTLGLDAKQFSVLSFESGGNLLAVSSSASSKIGRPADENKACLYFKGEGDYAYGKRSLASSTAANKSNIVLRFSKPTEESAYADANRVVRLQVFDFAGAKHIDNDQVGKLVFNPALSDILDGSGSFSGKLSSLLGVPGTATISSYTVVAFVNGRAGKAEATTSTNMWSAIATAIGNAKKSLPNPDGSYDSVLGEQGATWDVVADTTGKVTGSTDKYVSTLLDAEGRSALNAFDISISLAITASLVFAPTDTEAEVGSAYFNVDAGTVTVNGNSSSGTNVADVEVSLSTSAVLVDRDSYMYVGDANANWAAYYEPFRKETWDFSFSYDDYDANYASLQADVVLKASNYLVAQSNDIFGSYAIQWEDEVDEDGVVVKAADDLVTSLQYFQHEVTPNEIKGSSKSFAYAQALSMLLADNLTRWRCVCAPNLGDVMIKGDYVAAIESASESTLGVSNIGRAASVDALSNLNGRHGNRFIADYAVYGYRSLNGRRTAFTMACLVTDLLNRNYNNGNEARPPFGYTYGQVLCDELSQVMTGAKRQMLARQFKVNPVIEDGGYFTWDERTSQLKDTSLSGIHNILSFVWMKFQMYDAMKNFIAEYNDPETVSRGVSILDGLRLNWETKKYIAEGIVNADKNVYGDEVMRFTVAIRFKGVARSIEVDVTAYSQTQSLAISLAQEV